MNIIGRQSIRGITLIEALIALAVIALGLLAIARFYGELVASSGLSKARTEAVQLANTRIEDLRIRALGTAICETPPTSWTETDIAGTSATFRLDVDVTQETSLLVANVTVDWRDRRNELQTVALSSQISCDNPRLSVIVDADNLPEGNFIRSPVGRAERGGVYLGDPDPDGQTNDIRDITPKNLPGDLRVIRSGETTQLVLDTNESQPTVLLTMRSSTNVVGDEGFSTISGKVYFHKPSFPNNPFGTSRNQVDVPSVRLLASQGAECVKVFGNGVIVAEGFAPQPSPGPEGLFDSNSEYPYFTYHCFLGEGWYGNIGIIRLDSAGGDQGVCVGDPLPSQEAPFNDRGFLYNVLHEPANYRKYHADVCLESEEDNCVKWTAVGAGLILDESSIGSGNIEIIGYDAQRIGSSNSSDFLLVGGLQTQLNRRRDGCASAMDATLFSGNLGEYFCLTGQCEGVAGTETIGSIVEGNIVSSSTEPEPETWALMVNDIDGNPELIEGACSSIVMSDGSWTYKCELTLPGYTGVGEWTGGFTWPLPSTLVGVSQGDSLGYELDRDGDEVTLVNVPIGETAIVDLEVQ